MTRRLALVALLVLAASGSACGKYGKPVRVSPTPAAGVSAQPGATTPDAEACEEEPETPAP